MPRSAARSPRRDCTTGSESGTAECRPSPRTPSRWALTTTTSRPPPSSTNSQSGPTRRTRPVTPAPPASRSAHRRVERGPQPVGQAQPADLAAGPGLDLGRALGLGQRLGLALEIGEQPLPPHRRHLARRPSTGRPIRLDRSQLDAYTSKHMQMKGNAMTRARRWWPTAVLLVGDAAALVLLRPDFAGLAAAWPRRTPGWPAAVRTRRWRAWPPPPSGSLPPGWLSACWRPRPADCPGWPASWPGGPAGWSCPAPCAPCSPAAWAWGCCWRRRRPARPARVPRPPASARGRRSPVSRPAPPSPRRPGRSRRTR